MTFYADEGIFVNVDLSEAILKNTTLKKADLSHANLNDADLTGAKLDGCQIFGISVWNTLLDNAVQRNLRLRLSTINNEIIVDDIQTAIVLHLFSKRGGAREIIDTIASKVVLILGRFTRERKVVRHAIEEKLLEAAYKWVLPKYEYENDQILIESVSEEIIEPAETMVKKLRRT